MKERIKEFTILIVAACVGILTGLVASAFNGIVLLGTQWTRPLLAQAPYMFIVLPIFAALVTAYMYKTVLKHETSGIGIIQVLLEMKTPQTHLIKPKNVFWHVIATFVTLISGLTAGRFGPITHLGAAIGSNIAAKFNLEEEQMRLIIGCGASGAIATVFNLPFFATLFVMEVLFRERSFKFLAPLIVASVIADQVGVFLLGDRTQIVAQLGTQLSVYAAVLPCIALGVGVGIISALYIECIERAGKAMDLIKARWIRLVVAALAVGLSAYFFPDQFEIHFNTTNRIFSENMGIQLLLVLIFVRIATTALTLGSGFIGGNFYPGVTIGAAFGVLFWKLMTFLGIPIPSQGEMGILGIVGMIAGFLHAPLASVVLAIEISKNSSIIIPAMLVTSTALSVSYILCGYDIFSRPLGRLISKFYHQQKNGAL